ncbi:MAG TPA: carbamoyltransferase C-terminal domain-containing protein [Rhodocyclaceae bacterium]|nr:carbamoyltransferase C-terminal domain-containing protein [Rhodocyclaceae bacterium]
MYTLGINAAFYDSAACLVCDGDVIAAAEEERFTRIKHAKRPVPFSAWELPFNAIDYCLASAGITLADVEHVAYSFDPHLMLGRPQGDTLTLPMEASAAFPVGKDDPEQLVDRWSNPWEALFYSYVLNAPRQLSGGAPHHLRTRFRGAAVGETFQWHFVEHHLCHEASAFLAAPFIEGDDHTAVMTLDGRGERATATLAVWREGNLMRLHQVDYPHSLGLLYEDLTRYLGFLHASDEYKVMALASYGKPRYRDFFHDLLVLDGHGGFRITDPQPEVLLVRRFGTARERGEPLEQKHFDLAASLQAVLEHIALSLASWLRNKSGESRLCMAGGVALNCMMNAKIRDSGLFDQVWVQPAAGDAGTALGAALWVDYRQRMGPRRWQMDHAYLGPSYADEDIEPLLAWAQLPYRKVADIADETAALLAQDKIVGWFQDRMEFGPRALGARSILASPLNAAMQGRLNELKEQEDFRPMAPVVAEEAVGEWFVTGGEHPQPAGPAPFKLFAFTVAADKATRIPAAIHVDGTARVQTVSARWNLRYHQLLRAFAKRTGVPVLINTSFNGRGEPIVCTPRDAIAAFYSMPLDALAIGSYLLEKHP